MIFTALCGHSYDVKSRNRCLHYYYTRCTLLLMYSWCKLYFFRSEKERERVKELEIGKARGGREIKTIICTYIVGQIVLRANILIFVSTIFMIMLTHT